MADVIICCSELCRQQFSQEHRAQIARIYPPINVSLPAESDEVLRSAYDLPQDAVIISHVGTIAFSRGQDTAIAAVKELACNHPNLVLVLAGEPGANRGDEEFLNSLRQLVVDLDLATHVRFLGHVSRVEELMRISSVVVNPARFHEPFGRAVYEALAVGRPVVVTATGALTELLKDEQTAFIVPPGNPAGLAKAVHRILSDPDLGQTLVRNAKPILDALNQVDNDRQFMEIFAALT